MKKTIVASLLLLVSCSSVLAEEFDFGSVRRLLCTARNDRGQGFEVIGTYAPEAQDRALEKCYRFGSRSCFPRGCRIIYMRSGD